MNPHLYHTVIDWVPTHSRVLDLGTGDGSFLSELIQEKKYMVKLWRKILSS